MGAWTISELVTGMGIGAKSVDRAATPSFAAGVAPGGGGVAPNVGGVAPNGCVAAPNGGEIVSECPTAQSVLRNCSATPTPTATTSNANPIFFFRSTASAPIFASAAKDFVISCYRMRGVETWLFLWWAAPLTWLQLAMFRPKHFCCGQLRWPPAGGTRAELARR